MKKQTVFFNVSSYFSLVRTSLGLTQKQLSEQLEVHVQFVSNWERGKCLPPPKAMMWFLDKFSDREFKTFKAALGKLLADNLINRSTKKGKK